MVDALMMAYTVEMISIEKVVASVKRFSTFSASKELPYDLEDAMVFWINKVSARLALCLIESCLLLVLHIGTLPLEPVIWDCVILYLASWPNRLADSPYS